ncbi:hypothetical protein CSIM01_02369 [Colletotrichum simmondsii]|uniref:Uncharacterized protein n=1 Tax=Colletotrichum simmondsii TaxID=703756 RepID=A0A135SDQ1_9PEZI|nr:hypothetical protein CSIM01_02369 [Colletotrichum simmondsii]
MDKNKRYRRIVDSDGFPRDDITIDENSQEGALKETSQKDLSDIQENSQRTAPSSESTTNPAPGYRPSRNTTGSRVRHKASAQYKRASKGKGPANDQRHNRIKVKDYPGRETSPLTIPSRHHASAQLPRGPPLPHYAMDGSYGIPPLHGGYSTRPTTVYGPIPEMIPYGYSSYLSAPSYAGMSQYGASPYYSQAPQNPFAPLSMPPPRPPPAFEPPLPHGPVPEVPNASRSVASAETVLLAKLKKKLAIIEKKHEVEKQTTKQNAEEAAAEQVRTLERLETEKRSALERVKQDTEKTVRETVETERRVEEERRRIEEEEIEMYRKTTEEKFEAELRAVREEDRLREEAKKREVKELEARIALELEERRKLQQEEEEKMEQLRQQIKDEVWAEIFAKNKSNLDGSTTSLKVASPLGTGESHAISTMQEKVVSDNHVTLPEKASEGYGSNDMVRTLSKTTLAQADLRVSRLLGKDDREKVQTIETAEEQDHSRSDSLSPRQGSQATIQAETDNTSVRDTLGRAPKEMDEKTIYMAHESFGATVTALDPFLYFEGQATPPFPFVGLETDLDHLCPQCGQSPWTWPDQRNASQDRPRAFTSDIIDATSLKEGRSRSLPPRLQSGLGAKDIRDTEIQFSQSVCSNSKTIEHRNSEFEDVTTSNGAEHIAVENQSTNNDVYLSSEERAMGRPESGNSTSNRCHSDGQVSQETELRHYSQSHDNPSESLEVSYNMSRSLSVFQYLVESESSEVREEGRASGDHNKDVGSIVEDTDDTDGGASLIFKTSEAQTTNTNFAGIMIERDDSDVLNFNYQQSQPSQPNSSLQHSLQDHTLLLLLQKHISDFEKCSCSTDFMSNLDNEVLRRGRSENHISCGPPPAAGFNPSSTGTVAKAVFVQIE